MDAQVVLQTPPRQTTTVAIPRRGLERRLEILSLDALRIKEKEIAAAVGVKPNAVNNCLIRFGRRRRTQHNLTEENKIWILFMRLEEGKSQPTIARIMHRPVSTISHFLIASNHRTRFHPRKGNGLVEATSK